MNEKTKIWEFVMIDVFGEEVSHSWYTTEKKALKRIRSQFNSDVTYFMDENKDLFVTGVTIENRSDYFKRISSLDTHEEIIYTLSECYFSEEYIMALRESKDECVDDSFLE